MRKLVLVLAAVLFISACSEDSNNTSENRVVFSSAMTQNSVKSSVAKGTESVQADDYVDSVQITDFKILISRVMFHGGNLISEDSTFDDSKGLQFVTGAFIVRSDSVNRNIAFAEAKFKAGSYNKIKIEMHRFSSSDIGDFLGNLLFKDFVTNDRNTIVVRGWYYKNGERHYFIFRSNIVLNHTYNLNPPLVINATGTYNFIFEFDPSVMFRNSNGDVYNPESSSNYKEIEARFKASLKLHKK